MLFDMDATLADPWASPKFTSFARGRSGWRPHERELGVLLNTPGFSPWFWGAVFRRSGASIESVAAQLAPQNQSLVRENFLSVTADDAVMLAQHAAGARRGYHAPYFVRLAALELIDRGLTQSRVAAALGFGVSTVAEWVRAGPGKIAA